MTYDRFMTCQECGRFHPLSRADKSMLVQAIRPSTYMYEDRESMRRLAPFGICEAACNENGWQDVLVSAYDRYPQCDLDDWVPREEPDDEV